MWRRATGEKLAAQRRIAPPPGLLATHAREAARLSQLAYAPDAAAAAGCARLELDHVGSVRGAGGTLALLARRGNALLVAFRGTANLANLASDFDYALAPLGACGLRAGRAGGLRDAPVGCEVHAGFGRAYAGIGPRLLAALHDLAASHPGGAPALHLTVTGHSLGGALAALLAVDVAGDGAHAGARVAARDAGGLDFAAIDGFTFGAGRLGNDRFAAHFAQVLRGSPGRFLAFTLPADPLVQLPPRHLGYADHAAALVVARAERAFVGTDTACPGALGGLATGVSAWARRATLAADPVHSHRIATYCAAFGHLDGPCARAFAAPAMRR